jgi:hypothetical protein
MGRPRKRQFVETTIQEAGQNDNNQDPEPLFSFADNLDYNDDLLAEPYFATGQPVISSLDNVLEGLGTEVISDHHIWHFGDPVGGPPINFEDIDLGTNESNIPSLEPAPRLSIIPNPANTDQNPSSTIVGPCSCLASMYLSLASLQQFPSDIVSALKTVRGAAETAAKSLWCVQCGAVLSVLSNTAPPIEAFQNTMLLGTILPIIANGYKRLLKMVDEETDAAIAAGQTKTFRFHDYGGLGCREREATAQDAMVCIEKETFFSAVEMPPMQWRTTVRALLRIDIHGNESPGFKHKGLKDLVSEMEYRQRTRHALLDAAEAASTLDASQLGHGLSDNGKGKCLGEKTRGCLEILRMAKVAIDDLVIP